MLTTATATQPTLAEALDQLRVETGSTPPAPPTPVAPTRGAWRRWSVYVFGAFHGLAVLIVFASVVMLMTYGPTANADEIMAPLVFMSAFSPIVSLAFMAIPCAPGNLSFPWYARIPIGIAATLLTWGGLIITAFAGMAAV